MAFVEIKNLTKFYGSFKALDDLNLSLERGRIVGLLGKNGAGKSTLMQSMLGLLRYSGTIELDGVPVSRYRTRLFERVGFIPDVNGLDDRLTVRQTINFVAGINPSWKQSTALNLLDRSRLPLDKKVGKLSKGMKTKLYLLITLSLDVDLLLLDEPTLGLDIIFRKEFFNIILGEFFNDNRTIIISTHQVEEVEQILQDIIFLHDGKILLHEDAEQLKDRHKIISLPVERRDELQQCNPKRVTYTLGRINAIVGNDVEIEGAEYHRPGLADLFFAELGGQDEL